MRLNPDSNYFEAVVLFWLPWPSGLSLSSQCLRYGVDKLDFTLLLQSFPFGSFGNSGSLKAAESEIYSKWNFNLFHLKWNAVLPIHFDNHGFGNNHDVDSSR